MRAVRSPALIAGVISAVVAPLMATAYISAHGSFGASDLPAVAFWSVGLGALLITTLPLAYRRLVHLSRIGRAGVGATWGALCGILFTLAMAFGMQLWVATFSFPVVYVWSGAAAMGCAVGAQFVTAVQVDRQSGRKRRWSVGLALLVLMITGAAPVGFLLGSIYVWDRAEPEIHLLPAGFTGPVVILFNQVDGVPPRREGRARVYTIPASGVLRTQFPENSGWSAPKYYYVDATGRRSSIVTGAPCDNSLPGDPVEACLQGTLFLGNRPAPPYSAYVVGRRHERAIAAERVDSLVREVVYGEHPPRAR